MREPKLDRHCTREQFDAMRDWQQAAARLYQRSIGSDPVADARAFAIADRACEALGMCEPGVSEKVIAEQPAEPVSVIQLMWALNDRPIEIVTRVDGHAFDVQYRANLQTKNGPKYVACSAGFAHSEYQQPAERTLRKLVGAFEILLRGCIQTVGGKPL